MKLLFDPFLYSHGLDFFHVAGSRPEGEPIQSVQRALATLHLGTGFRRFCGAPERYRDDRSR